MALVVGADAMSRIVDWTDCSTCILFGDGAGAAVVEMKPEGIATGAVLGCAGDDGLLSAAGPGSVRPSVISMDGQRVFRFAVEKIAVCVDGVPRRAGVSLEDVRWFVLHQANARIIELAA